MKQVASELIGWDTFVGTRRTVFECREYSPQFLLCIWRKTEAPEYASMLRGKPIRWRDMEGFLLRVGEGSRLKLSSDTREMFDERP